MSRQRLRQLPQLTACRSMQQECFENGPSSQFALPPEKRRAVLTNITQHTASNACRDSHPAANSGTPIKALPGSKNGLSFQTSVGPIKPPVAAAANFAPSSNNSNGVVAGYAQQLKPTTPKITPLGTVMGGGHMTSGTNASVSASLNALPSVVGRNRPNLPPLKQVSQSTSELPVHVLGAGTANARTNVHAASAACGAALAFKEHHHLHPHLHHQSLGAGASHTAAVHVPAPPPPSQQHTGRKRPFQVAFACIRNAIIQRLQACARCQT
jgi:hypothetical protein